MNFSNLQENNKQAREGYSKRSSINNESNSPANVNIKNILDGCKRITKLCEDLDNTIDETNEESGYPLIRKRSRDQITSDTQIQKQESNIAKIKEYKNTSIEPELYPIIPNNKQHDLNTKCSFSDKNHQEHLVNSTQHEIRSYKSHKTNINISINQRTLSSKDVNKVSIRSMHNPSKKNNYDIYGENYKVPLRRLSAATMYKDKGPNSGDDELEATRVIEPEKPYEPKYVTVNNEKYLILSDLGEGGYGAVYKVYHLNKREVFALKDIKGKGKGDELKKSILNEVYYLSQAKQRDFKYTVRIYDYQILPSGCKIVMELGDVDFQKALRRQIEEYPVNFSYIKYFWGQILYAVKEWHDTLTLHKDLKPQNFILKEGRIKLIDFGTTVALGHKSVEVSERAIGTLNYMAPETLILSGRSEAGLPADIWSLGCILYEMIYKRPPLHCYSGDRKREILMNGGKDIDGKTDIITYPKYVDWMSAGGNFKYKRVYTTYIDNTAIDCIKGCLNFDPKKRLTINELIEHPFIKYFELKN
ncbi:unnamed protein product [Cunninghamella blakesleeana]